MASENPDLIHIAGFPVLRTDRKTLAARLRENLLAGEQISLFFANANFVVHCDGMEAAMSGSKTIIVNDGIGLDIGAWLLSRRTFAENLNGTDFVPFLLEQLQPDIKVFLLGGRPGVASRAARHFAAKGVCIVGARDGYGSLNSTELSEQINASGAEVVLVALGNPLQEQWILEHRERLQARLLVAVGALFDFAAGEVARAPLWLRRLRLEWLFRLVQEPRRLLRRYTWDMALFLVLCLRRRGA